MAAYRRVYDSRRLQADCQEPGSAPVTEYGLPLPFFNLRTLSQTILQSCERIARKKSLAFFVRCFENRRPS